MSPGDTFGAREMRAATWRVWRDNPARFREDANTEEDYARGYYRDRVITELAQNAADAAASSGGATFYGSGGRVVFALRPDDAAPSRLSLHVFNTGHPLTPSGAASLSGLRTSAKRGPRAGAPADAQAPAATQAPATSEAPAIGSIGRFGVGFSAVRAVSDDILVRSRTGGLRFSLERFRAELNAAEQPAPESSASEPPVVDGLLAELERRGDELPILRLPWAAESLDSDEFATEIVLRLRDERAVELVRELLGQVDDRLLLALPRLEAIDVEIDGDIKSFNSVEERWAITRQTGEVPTELLPSLPVEERENATWAVTWATRADEPSLGGDALLNIGGADSGFGGGRSGGGSLAEASTLLAPTQTDEPITLPGVLIMTVPLEPTRRRVRPGPVTDWVLGKAGEVAAQHAAKMPDPLMLVPLGLPAGEVDAALHETIRGALSSAPILRTIDGHPIAPSDATAIVLSTATGGGLNGAVPVVDESALGELASGLEGIVDIPRHRLAHAGAVGVNARDVADAIAEMPAGRTPQRWHETYSALTGLTREVGGLAALSALPIPLADGRVVAGARGAFMVSDDVPNEELNQIAGWGLRIIATGAHHQLLESLGGVSVYAGQLLDEPETRAAALGDESNLDALLNIVASAVQHTPADDEVEGPIRAWLPDVALPTEADEWMGAGGMMLPGSAAEELFEDGQLEPLDEQLAQSWPSEVWRALGVRDGLIVVRQSVMLDAWNIDGSIDEVLDDPSIGILDRLDEYLDALADYWLDEETGEPGEVLNFELATLADLDIVTSAAWSGVKKRAQEWLSEHGKAVEIAGGRDPFPHYLKWWLET